MLFKIAGCWTQPSMCCLPWDPRCFGVKMPLDCLTTLEEIWWPSWEPLVRNMGTHSPWSRPTLSFMDFPKDESGWDERQISFQACDWSVVTILKLSLVETKLMLISSLWRTFYFFWRSPTVPILEWKQKQSKTLEEYLAEIPSWASLQESVVANIFK